MRFVGACSAALLCLVLLFNALAFTGWFFEWSNEAEMPGYLMGLLVGAYFLMWALPVLAGIVAYRLFAAAPNEVSKRG